ncbi:hypothetical protein JHW43_006129 [Diplocarpon mali]|nr:hypothetical protein JHW43_006129 [Diplocarpon mali]
MLAFRPQDEAAFLASEPTWKNRIGQGWHGTKLLGKGSFGVTGLWEYLGDDPKAPALKQVVVKQSQFKEYELGSKSGKTTLDEGNLGLMIAGINARHIVRQYGGNRLGDRFAHMEEVVKIFLEYCPGGDLNQFIPGRAGESRSTKIAPEPLSEMDAWAIFNCLALGVHALDRRSENTFDNIVWEDDEELMHCDLKCDNVFLGFRDQDHDRLPIAKIGDFGEAKMVPSQDLQDDEYGGTYSDRGAPAFKPPEETPEWPFGPWQKTGIPLEHPRKGTCSNIWQIGAIMNSLLLQENFDFNPERCDDPRDPRTARSSLAERGTTLALELNHSIRLNTGEGAERYSKSLRMLIQECLLREAPLRPTSTQLANDTLQGLNVVMSSVLLLTQRTGLSGLQGLPAGLPNIPMRPTGFQDPEPPTSFLVEHRAWDDAFAAAQATTGTRLGGFVTPSAGPVSALAGSAAVSAASSAANSAANIAGSLAGFGLRYLTNRVAKVDPGDGSMASMASGYLGKAHRAPKTNANANAKPPGSGRPVIPLTTPPIANFQVDEPGYVVVNMNYKIARP